MLRLTLTDGYLNQLLLVDARAAYIRITPDSRSIKESAMVANNDRDFEEMAAYNCNTNSNPHRAVNGNLELVCRKGKMG